MLARTHCNWNTFPLLHVFMRRGVELPTPTDLIDTVRKDVKDLGLTLVIEPGRSMVATSCALVNTVTGETQGVQGLAEGGGEA